jgi:hypothetical protein
MNTEILNESVNKDFKKSYCIVLRILKDYIATVHKDRVQDPHRVFMIRQFLAATSVEMMTSRS